MSELREREGQRRSARETLRRRIALLRMLGEASPWLVGAASVTAVVAGLLPVALILAGGLLSARIASAVAAGGTAASLHAVYRTFALVLGLFLASEVIVPVQNRLRWLVTKEVDGMARQRVMTAALAGTDMSRLHGEDYSNAMSLARGLIRWSATPGGGAAGLIGLARDYLTGVAATAVLAVFQPVVALTALVVALLLRVRWRRATIAIINVWIESAPDRREGAYFTELGLGRTAGNEVRLFGLREWLRERIHVAGLRAWVPTWRQRKIGMGRNTLVQVALTAGVGVTGLVWAARASARGELGVGGLVVFVSTLFTVLGTGRYFDDDTPVEYGGVVLPAIQTLERLATATVGGEAGRRRPASDRAPSIQLNGVSFRYPGADSDALRDVDLIVPAGTSAAIVGINGAGKTTLVRLLCGLYPPDQGIVSIDGTDVRDLDLAAWHRLAAPMFQEFLRLPATVGQNAGVGAVEHLDDVAGIRAALAEAGALEFSERLPHGIDSLLATRYADGTDLSGGQWQRLGVARALFAVRHGARLLLLDEPTANLDTSSEERLVTRLLDETRGRVTTILVTHRLGLARRADRIVVLERGRVVEEGDHDALIALGGRYASAFGMQASLYPTEDGDG